MINFLTKQGAMQTWLVTKMADLSSLLPVRQTGFLFLDAQITDLENRCAASHERFLHHRSIHTRAGRLWHRSRKSASTI